MSYKLPRKHIAHIEDEFIPILENAVDENVGKHPNLPANEFMRITEDSAMTADVSLMRIYPREDQNVLIDVELHLVFSSDPIYDKIPWSYSGTHQVGWRELVKYLDPLAKKYSYHPVVILSVGIVTIQGVWDIKLRIIGLFSD